MEIHYRRPNSPPSSTLCVAGKLWCGVHGRKQGGVSAAVLGDRALTTTTIAELLLYLMLSRLHRTPAIRWQFTATWRMQGLIVFRAAKQTLVLAASSGSRSTVTAADKELHHLHADRTDGLGARRLICANPAKSRESITWLTSPQLAQSATTPLDPPTHRSLLEPWRQCCGTSRRDQILPGSAIMPGLPYLRSVRLSKIPNRRVNPSYVP